MRSERRECLLVDNVISSGSERDIFWTRTMGSIQFDLVDLVQQGTSLLSYGQFSKVTSLSSPCQCSSRHISVILESVFKSQISDIFRSLQKAQEIARSMHKTPEIARSMQKTPEIARSLQKTPEIARSMQKTPEIARSMQKTPEIARSMQKDPNIL
ncbi:hypothetical protein Btru_029416, partial [Bulinus truncatus]